MRRFLAATAVLTWLLAGCAQPGLHTAPAAHDQPTTKVGRPEFQPRTPLLERTWTTDPEKFHFAILGDKTGGGEENWPIFDRAVDEINLMQPDFVIMVGDLIQGGTRDTTKIAAMWAEFWEHAGRLKVPFFRLPGNHDISNEVMYRYWREHFGRTYYSFDYMDCHFIALDTEERWGGGPGEAFGTEQVRWVAEDLATQRQARHTFVLMHKPAWQWENSTEWAAIEQALGNRPYTILAGHYHHNEYEIRRDRRYIVLSATGAGLNPVEVRQVGSFHHWTWVTVDGDSAHMAYVEPGGPMWPENIAPRAFRDSLRRLLDVSALLPQNLDSPAARTGLRTTIANRLADTITVDVEVLGLDAVAWRTDVPKRTARVPPGGDETLDLTFTIPRDSIVPIPRIRAAVRYRNAILRGFESSIPLFPDSTLRSASEWQVAGVFPGGPTPNRPPENPREAMPKAFRRYGPEGGYTAGATFDAGGKTVSWRPVSADARGSVDFTPLFSTPDSALAYALCGVHSQANRTVYAEFRADDYGQVLVNGELLDGGRLHRTRSDAVYIALPLKSGWNAVIVKTINIGGGWSFRLRFADPDKSLRFASHPE